MNLDPAINEEVRQALHDGAPVVALESTVISHGLPYPDNLNAADRMIGAVRDRGAVPAMTAVIDGDIRVGLSDKDVERLVEPSVRKLSVRDLPVAIALGIDGATTVATTSLIARACGIQVFATGGIGGVHRGYSADVSADLPVLASTPITVVCSGAKSILDLPATREWLETWGVPVIGFRTNEFPAFYCSGSGLDVDERVDTALEVASVIRTRDSMKLSKAVLVGVPVPEAEACDAITFNGWLESALAKADSAGISGKEVTPFLLSAIGEMSGGRTVAANIALLENNASVAAEISSELTSSE